MNRKLYRVENWGDDGATTAVLLTEEEADAFAYVVALLHEARTPHAPVLTIEEAQ